MVGGLGLRADGRVLVIDDVALITDGEPLGMGRLVQVGGPAARVAAGPSNVAGQTALDPTHTGRPTPRRSRSPATAPLECWVRQADSTTDPAFAPCEGDVHGGQLADGEHLLTVRAARRPCRTPRRRPRPASCPTRCASRSTPRPRSPPDVDVTAVARPDQRRPVVHVHRRRARRATGSSWTCRLNGAAAQTPCAPGRTFPLVDDGQSQLRSRAATRSSSGRSTWPATPAPRRRSSSSADTSLPTVTFSAPAARQQGTTRRRSRSPPARPGPIYGCGFDDDGLGPCPAGTVQSNGSGRASLRGPGRRHAHPAGPRP